MNLIDVKKQKSEVKQVMKLK